jgi:hypothetical protein
MTIHFKIVFVNKMTREDFKKLSLFCSFFPILF